MRKIAAHYYLRPNNTIGKFPVITFDKSGYISEIRERESFTEESFMEHVNGLLIPKLISSISDSFFSQEFNVQLKQLRFFVVRGNSHIIYSSRHHDQLKLLIKNVPLLKAKEVMESPSFSAFEELSKSDSLLDFFKCKQSNLLPLFDSDLSSAVLKVGVSPGILALSGIGKEPFKWSSKSKMKIIV